MKYSHANAQDITIEEQEITHPEDVAIIVRVWTATYDGKVHEESAPLFRQNGPQVSMSRMGNSAEEAYRNLVEAMHEQGWTLS